MAHAEDDSAKVRMRMFDALLKDFSRLRNRAGATREDKDLLASHEILLDGFREVRELWCKSQAATADDFNILKALQLADNELCHSRVLAWLLDHDLGHLGTHAQGSAGFKLFLDEFRLPASYADHLYWVHPEEPGEESRIDIEIACKGEFVIHIENKIWAGLGEKQIEREASDLEKRSQKLKVPVGRTHGFYLTPEGRETGNPKFKPVSWSQIGRILDQFADAAAPPDVKLFCRHYAQTLRSFVAPERKSEEKDDG